MALLSIGLCSKSKFFDTFVMVNGARANYGVRGVGEEAKVKGMATSLEDTNARDALNDPAMRAGVQAELLGWVMHHYIAPIAITVVNTALVAYVFRDQASAAAVLGWLVYMTLVVLLRVGLYLSYRRMAPPSDTALWGTRFTAVMGLLGLGWGFVSLGLTPSDSVPYLAFTAFLVAGMAVGGLVSLYPHRGATVAFVAPLVLPLVYAFLIDPTEVRLVMAFMVLLFFAFLLLAARRLRATLEETLALRFLNESLSLSLGEEKKRIQALSRELRAESTERARAVQGRMDSETRYRRVVENAADAILVHDARGYFLDANQQACDSLGYSRGELLSMNVTDVEKGADIDALSRIWTQRGDETFPVTLEGEHWRKDGSVFPVEVRLGLLDDRDELLFIAVVRDITERKKIDRMKSEFISTVSHELRTPLTSIIGSLGLLSGGGYGDMPAKVKGMLALAERNAKRLVDLVNDILDFEKLESGRATFKYEPVDLAALIRETVATHHGYTENLGVQVVLDGVTDPVKVTGDDKRLGQVLSNLLANAAKFSNPGGDVTITLSRNGDTARVDIADQGDGIPAAFHDKIFTRFSQAGNATTRRQGGTGLGLAISKAIVEAHGGTLGFESEEGHGSVFHVKLPLTLSNGE